jgi:hypothetical protein
VGKANTQKIKRKYLTLRTRIKRLARKTICFSKPEWIHNIMIELLSIVMNLGVLFNQCSTSIEHDRSLETNQLEMRLISAGA